MNIIKNLRNQVGITQQEFADKVQTSQSTIAAYESGSKSPTMRTVQRFASDIGLELISTFTPSMNREDRRSLAFHRAIAVILEQNPEPTLVQARKNLRKLTQLHPNASSLFSSWKTWLQLPTRELVNQMLNPDLIAREMRQTSPFSGILTTQERTQVLKRFRREYRK